MNRIKNTGLVLCGLVLGLSLSAPAAQAVYEHLHPETEKED